MGIGVLRVPPHVIKHFPLEHLIIELLYLQGCLDRCAHCGNGTSDWFWRRALLLKSMISMISFLLCLFQFTINLKAAVGGIEFMLGDCLVEGYDLLDLFVLGSLGNLFFEDRLALLIKQLNDSLSHHFFDGLLNLSVVKGHVDVLAVLSANFVSKPLEELHADLLHDAQVGSLSDFGDDLASVLVVQVGSVLTALFF